MRYLFLLEMSDTYTLKLKTETRVCELAFRLDLNKEHMKIMILKAVQWIKSEQYLHSLGLSLVEFA
jgi:hypothetical protein